MRVRSLAVPFLALLPLLLLTGPAFAQGYTEPAGSLVLGASEARPGGTVTVSGSGCRAGSIVSIEFQPGPVSLGTVQADNNGNFSTMVTIPANATPGIHTIVTTCTSPTGVTRVLSSTISVLGAALTRDETLPRTGSSNSVPMGVAGAALVGVGAVTVLATRRKRAAS